MKTIWNWPIKEGYKKWKKSWCHHEKSHALKSRFENMTCSSRPPDVFHFLYPSFESPCYEEEQSQGYNRWTTCSLTNFYSNS